MVFDGILCGHHEERLRERLGFAVHADLRFVHGFEKRRLRARRRAIDFVGEHDVGENGSGTKLKFAILRVIDADAENVARKQVRSELNALEAAVKRFGERLRQRSLADAGNIFDKQMAAREQRDERELDGFFFAENGACDGALQL